MSTQWPAFWNDIPDNDRPALSDVLAELLASGAVIGGSGRDQERYQTIRAYRPRIEEYFAPLRLELIEDPDSPIYLLRPVAGECDLLATFTKPETLLVLTLWRMQHDIRMNTFARAAIVTVKDIFEQLKIYFENVELPGASALEVMLAKLRARRLVRVKVAESGVFEETEIEILPTLPRVIPFNELAEWDARREAATPADVETNDTENQTTPQ